MRVWGMVEVFLIGILVTLVKLMGMVLVIPEISSMGICGLEPINGLYYFRKGE
ncbi:paraquat-inducible protein A [Acinetobacter baumannii]